MIATLVITGWSWLWLALGVAVGMQIVELAEKLVKRIWSKTPNQQLRRKHTGDA